MITKNKQAGITFISFIIVCIVLVVFIYVGIRIWPIFNEKFKVDGAIASVTSRDDIATLSTRTIGRYMLRTFEIDDLDRFSAMDDFNNILEIKKVKGKKERNMHMNYEIRRPIIGKFSIIYEYDKMVTIDGIGR